MHDSFWSVHELDLDDSLNLRIWTDSPGEQERIQPYRADWKIGDIGAQQAMRHPHRLPWVPDPVGLDWRSRDAMLILGSAYGPFIGGDNRPGEMEPQEYDCESSGDFLKCFLRQVVETRPYYRKIADLASTAIPSCRLLALADLCRVAYVRREDSKDFGGDLIARSAAELFSEFVESNTASMWLWRRIVESEASAMVALGTVAEHGILRLFSRHLQDFSIRDSQDETIRFLAREGNAGWLSQYAHGRRQLQDRSRATVPPFWEISGQVMGGVRRTWRLAVVPHPTGAWAQSGGYPSLAVQTVYGRPR
jgi:hypothetical protein